MKHLPGRGSASHRRTYRRSGDLLRDLAVLGRHPRAVLHLLRGVNFSPAFRERLMLVVTAVNRCRHCAAFHRDLAVRAGVPEAEARRLLAGIVDDAPPDQLLALLYARWWAERDGRMDAEQRQALVDHYGPDRVAAIEVALHAIRIGNLVGNAADLLLCRLSRGRFGCGRFTRRSSVHTH